MGVLGGGTELLVCLEICVTFRRELCLLVRVCSFGFLLFGTRTSEEDLFLEPLELCLLLGWGTWEEDLFLLSVPCFLVDTMLELIKSNYEKIM
jgi:hypothetical protein